MKSLILFFIIGATITLTQETSAEVLHFPDPQESCYETKDAAGIAVSECEFIGVHGYDEQFCHPLPGFDESYDVAEGVGSTWRLIDCSDGRIVDILVRDTANGIELKNEMLAYRELLLDAGTKPTISEITEHMASIGGKSEFRSEILSPEETKRFCSHAVVREEPCLSGAEAEEN